MTSACLHRRHINAEPGDLLNCWKSSGFSRLANETNYSRIGLLLGFESGHYQVWHSDSNEVIGYLIHEVKDFVSQAW